MATTSEISNQVTVLTDSARNLSVHEWKLSSHDVGGEWAESSWSITKRVLAGGRQDGVEVIEVNNGLLTFTVVPTRGFQVWAANAGDVRLGWDSPVKEIVHPKFVNLAERGGLGWLNGFGEMVSRCGLESLGPPCDDSGRVYTLHGRINYIPASYVEVRLESKPRPRIVLRGVVDESLMFGPQLRLTSEISTELGSTSLRFDDTVTNLSDQPQEMESLYHANFGPPLLAAGAQFVAPVKKVWPRNARAAEGGMIGWNQYTGPHSGDYTEQVYFMELYADESGKTKALLKSADGSKAVAVSFDIRQLPYLTLWKNEGPAQSGYVTGLEPGTSFPNPKPAERAAGRVPKLVGGESRKASVTITALRTSQEVERALDAIRAMQKGVEQVLTDPQ
ncbi:MAG TPA: aldose 1-epimerase family protein [Chthoniobacterales bacterium]|nr:aldose 1-epimerase family protein [Chthoniobacterales bacterium]